MIICKASTWTTKRWNCRQSYPFHLKMNYSSFPQDTKRRKFHQSSVVHLKCGIFKAHIVFHELLNGGRVVDVIFFILKLIIHHFHELLNGGKFIKVVLFIQKMKFSKCTWFQLELQFFRCLVHTKRWKIRQNSIRISFNKIIEFSKIPSNKIWNNSMKLPN